LREWRQFIELIRKIRRRILRARYQFVRYIFLSRLIKDKKVLIIGSGLSAKKLKQIPEGFLVFTCNRGVKLLNDVKFKGTIDLYFTFAHHLRKHKETQENLQSVKIKIFIIDDLNCIKNRPFLNKSYQYLLQDNYYNNRYLEKLIRPQRVYKLKGSSFPWTSSGMRLLQYALYFKAKEIYLIGFDLDTKGYFDGQPNQSDHIDIDNNLMMLLVEKYTNIYSLTNSLPDCLVETGVFPRDFQNLDII